GKLQMCAFPDYKIAMDDTLTTLSLISLRETVCSPSETIIVGFENWCRIVACFVAKIRINTKNGDCKKRLHSQISRSHNEINYHFYSNVFLIYCCRKKGQLNKQGGYLIYLIDLQ
ncbi:hypothetical protein HZS_2101, partial [Henneguya salminicola]